MKKTTIFVIISLLLSVGSLSAQTDFEHYRQQQQENFNRYRAQSQEQFDNYRDSLNRRYADFLEQEWKRFALQNPEPFIKNPITVPPVYDQTKPQPAPEEVEAPKPPIVPTPDPPTVPDVDPAPVPSATINATFFGTNIRLSNLNFQPSQLTGASETAVADYWRSLSIVPHSEIVNDVMRVKSELTLNDWGLYQLLGKVFETYAPNGNENEKVVFSVFMLNQMGYRAKIGRSGVELIPLIAFENEVTNCMYFWYGENASTRYYTINPLHKALQSVETCNIDYDEGLRNMNLHISDTPKFASAPIARALAFSGKTFTLNINKNTTDFYKDYPCVEFSTYADAPLDLLVLKSIEEVIRPEIANKSQVEAVNWLLHFVQNAFEYKTDANQFGYEKFFFAEETIASSYSDCEDRSILFTQLVRRLLDMPVVLIYYPGVHLATAVKFDDTTRSGNYVLVDGEKYLICDPTYINATIGMSMPDLRNTQVEIIM